MDDELVDVVNENNVVIGLAQKSECHKKGLWHRSAVIFIFNNQGHLLIQKRSPLVERPNKWAASAAGHISKGESYLSAAKRELNEELGISCELKSIGNFSMTCNYSNGKIDKEHYELFLGTYEGKFNLGSDEVSEVKFIPINELKAQINQNPQQYTPGFQKEFLNYLDTQKSTN